MPSVLYFSKHCSAASLNDAAFAYHASVALLLLAPVCAYHVEPLDQSAAEQHCKHFCCVVPDLLQIPRCQKMIDDVIKYSAYDILLKAIAR